MRRMEERLESGGDGEIASARIWLPLTIGSGRQAIQPASCVGLTMSFEGAAAGGTACSDVRAWQHGIASMPADASHPRIIPWQQAGWSAGVIQASAGRAVHMTTDTSNRSARFLPTCIVYPHLENEPNSDVRQ